jgi:hypothetical protein
MVTDIVGRRARLRGGLPDEPLGAREVEHAARNPGCLRLQALTVAGVSPKTAAKAIYREDPREGRSPFAIATGNTFEAQLLGDGAARLLTAYRDAERLALADSKLLALPQRAPGNSPEALRRRREETRVALRRKLGGEPGAPNLIVKPRLALNVAGVEYGVEPDILVAADAESFYRPVEIKSAYDRGGKTDAADLRGALRQAAVEVQALREELVRLGVPPRDALGLVPPTSDLLLRVPGTMFPSLRAGVDVAKELFSIRRFQRDAARVLETTEEAVRAAGSGASLAKPEALDHVPNNFLPSCAEFCPLARRCRAEATKRGEPAILGVAAREALAPAGDLRRARELALGQGDPPRSPEEANLAARLQTARQALREVVEVPPVGAPP